MYKDMHLLVLGAVYSGGWGGRNLLSPSISVCAYACIYVRNVM